MKQSAGISASIAAVFSSLATIGCCVSLGFAAALGAAGVSAFLVTLRPYFVALSVVLLSVGFWQQHRATQCTVRHRWLGKVLLWSASVVVLGMILFPQQVAGFISDHLSGAYK